MMAKTELDYEVLVETEKENTDYYYKKLKKHGWYDFVSEFVEPNWNIDGVRIDTKLSYPKTILAKTICCQNVTNLLGQVKHMKSLP